MDQEKNSGSFGSNQYLGDIENFDSFDKETGNLLDKETGNFDDRGTYGYGEPLLTRRANTTSQIAIVGANLCPIESLDYE